MILRKAKFDDWKILLDWRNDPISRANSFDQNEITEETHKSWFSKSLKNPERSVYILEDKEKKALGIIRCDLNQDNTKTLSWNINPSNRGQGYGGLILKIFMESNEGNFIAEIKEDNIASIKMAEKNGFVQHSKQVYKFKK